MRKLLEELKRRNVIRVAVAYAIASWLLLQIADLVLDNTSAPAWVMQVFMLALALGFPLVLLFSWAFELTPEGLKREKEVEAERPVTLRTAHKLDRITIALLVLVLGVIVIGRLFPATPPQTAAAVAEVPDKSIAVLAFKDFSPKGDQAYFAEGISEELLNVLAQIPDLKVAGRTSSFAFKGQHRGLREIGEILHVAHVLEGSVRKDGNRIRITAQLVDTDTGFHAFSKSYDRTLDDIFAVQDDIAREISAALRSAIFGSERAIAPSRPTVPEAYSNFLRARQWVHTRDANLMAQAVELLDRSIGIDPNYAPAYAQKATAILLLSDSGGSYGQIPAVKAERLSRPLIDRALELDPTLAEAHAVLGLWYVYSGKLEEGIASLRRAVEINPVLADANNWLAAALDQTGAIGESRALYEAVIERDPLFAPAFLNLIITYLHTHDSDKAEALLHRVERIDGASPRVLFARGSIALDNGEAAAAVESLRTAYELNPNATVRQVYYGYACFAVGDYETAAGIGYPSARLIYLTLAGRQKEAEALFESLADGKISNFEDFSNIANWYLLQDRPADLVRFMESRFGSEDFIAALPPSTGQTALYTDLVFALRQLGRNADADRLMRLAAEVLDYQASQNADDSFFWLNRAEYSALSGDPETMLAHLRRAVDRGYVAVIGLWSSAFDRYRVDPRFIELENEVIRRAKEERRKLGMIES